MSETRTRRVLVVGHGGMGGLYADALSERGALGGILVRTEASRERARARRSVPVGTELEAILGEVVPDAMAIFTTTEHHATYLREAIRRRLPALVIKPATTRPETARAIQEEAALAGVPVLVAHEGVFQPQFAAIEAALAEGEVGRVREVQWLKEGNEQLSGGRAREEPRPEDAEGRNFGFVYATVMHELYVANRLAGRRAPESAEVTQLRASATNARLEASATYPGGVVGRIRYNMDPAIPFRRGLHVLCERGSLLWTMQAGRTVLQQRSADGRGGQGGVRTRDLPFAGFSGANPATPVVGAFLSVLAGESPVGEDLTDGARALEAARIVTRAAGEHAGVALDLDALAGGTDH